MSSKYLFIGGPYHGKTLLSSGHTYIEMVQIKPTKATFQPVESIPIETAFSMVRYRRREIGLFSNRRYIYTIDSLTDDEANALMSAVLTKIFDTFVEA